MANYFELAKSGNQAMMWDGILLAVGGAVHLFPNMLAPVAGWSLGPISVQMVVGAVSLLRAVDMWFMK